MVRLYIYAGICGLCFGCGWLVHGWFVDSKGLAAVEAVREAESAIASQLETKLAELRANERTIIREIPKIIERPVYHNQCIDNDGLLLVNQSKGGTAEPAR